MKIPTLLFLAAVSGAGFASAQASDPAAKPSSTSPACVDCHDQAASFSSNPHSKIRVAGSPVAGDAACVTCHGNVQAHLDSSGEKAVERPLTGIAGAQFCVTCHQTSRDRDAFRMSVHAASASANCLSCHSIHSSVPKTPSLLLHPRAQLCASCHAIQTASLHEEPFVHRLDGNAMSCVSCHDPHGRHENSSLRVTRSGDLPCLSCHTEKRGPFVFEHVNGVAGDCMSCHAPHGSSNPKQLIRAQVSQLCLECHSRLSAKGFGSQAPSFHNLALPRYQNCTTCHVGIHGSNFSPVLLR